jgi:Spy/CpxP family protein refolding chaperone
MRHLLALVLLTPAIVVAQTPPPPPGASTVYVNPSTPMQAVTTVQQQVVPSFERALFPPELVMQHQRALELTPQQRTAISDAVKALQNQAIDLQWNLQAEQQALLELLEQRPIREPAVLAQMNKLLELEAAVKRTHLTTLVRIKNALTDQQVEQLMRVRGRWTPSLNWGR